MILLIIDTEPKWVQFLQATYPRATLDPAAPWTLAIVSARQIRDVAPEVWQRGAVVATSQETTAEEIRAFRMGALDYFPKDFRAEKIAAVLERVAEVRR